MQDMDSDIGKHVSGRIPISADCAGGLPFADPYLKWNYVSALVYDLAELLRTVRLPSRECDPAMLNKFQSHELIYMDVFKDLFPRTTVQLKRVKTKINILIVDDIMEALDSDIDAFGESAPIHFQSEDDWKQYMAELMAKEMSITKKLRFEQVYGLYQVFKQHGIQGMKDHYRFTELAEEM